MLHSCLLPFHMETHNNTSLSRKHVTFPFTTESAYIRTLQPSCMTNCQTHRHSSYHQPSSISPLPPCLVDSLFTRQQLLGSGPSSTHAVSHPLTPSLYLVSPLIHSLSLHLSAPPIFPFYVLNIPQDTKQLVCWSPTADYLLRKGKGASPRKGSLSIPK